MALFLVVLSLTLHYLSPVELFPWLGPYRIQVLILVPAIAASLPALVAHQERLTTPHYKLMVGLWFAVVVSLLSHFWLGGSLEGFLAFGVVACFYFLILINAYNPSRVRVVCITIVVCALVMSVQGMLAYHTG